MFSDHSPGTGLRGSGVGVGVGVGEPGRGGGVCRRGGGAIGRSRAAVQLRVRVSQRVTSRRPLRS